MKNWLSEGDKKIRRKTAAAAAATYCS